MFQDIEELHRRGDGYVLWRGIYVEHYTYPDDEKDVEREAAHALAARCRHLEALGVDVRRQNQFSWFADMTPDTPAEYRAFVGCAGNFLEHPDGSLAWQFSYDARRYPNPVQPDPKHNEMNEIEAIYIWKNGALERREYVGRIYQAGIYHPLRAEGWKTADCGNGPDLYGVTWDQLRALFERHGLTPKSLAVHVLASMPSPPPPPKPVATLAEARRALAREVRRGMREGGGSLPEADDDINDASRAVVRFMAAERGEAWLGKINLYGNERHGGALVMWQWDGTSVYNFGADFVCPTHDAELERLIHERDAAPYTTTAADAARVDAILARLEEVGGIHLYWT